MSPTDPNNPPLGHTPSNSPTSETSTVRPTANRRRQVVMAVVVALLAAVFWHAQHRSPTPPAQMTFAPVEAPEPTPDSFRVALLNMRRGKGTDNRDDLNRTAASIAGFDLVVLNEVGGSTWTSKVNQADQLAAMLDMQGYFFPSQRRFYRDDNGNALLTRFPLLSWKCENLIRTQGQGHRNVVTCHVRLGSETVALVITHTDGQADREAQMHAVFERFHDADAPVIMAGDLNCRSATHPTLATATERGAIDALTETLHDQDHWRRDWIFARGLELVDGGLIDKGASDHPCYWAEFRFKK